jgi:pyruvate/oxaloacetate carboxyltransferase
MPVEIRELIIRASIEQKSAKVEGLVADLTNDQIEKIKYEIKSEIEEEIKEKINEIIYNK